MFLTGQHYLLIFVGSSNFWNCIFWIDRTCFFLPIDRTRSELMVRRDVPYYEPKRALSIERTPFSHFIDWTRVFYRSRENVSFFRSAEHVLFNMPFQWFLRWFISIPAVYLCLRWMFIDIAHILTSIDVNLT